MVSLPVLVIFLVKKKYNKNNCDKQNVLSSLFYIWMCVWI